MLKALIFAAAVAASGAAHAYSMPDPAGDAIVQAHSIVNRLADVVDITERVPYDIPAHAIARLGLDLRELHTELSAYCGHPSPQKRMLCTSAAKKIDALQLRVSAVCRLRTVRC